MIALGNTMNRRDFLKISALAIVACTESSFAYTQKELDEFYLGDRSLWLVRGNASVNVVYYRDGKYLRNKYEELCYLLKDVHEDIAVEMDAGVFDILSYSQKWAFMIGVEQPIVATSGYRTPNTNAETENAARKSFHLRGKAIDGHIPGIAHEYFGAIAAQVGGGGIGVYKTHTHIDTGSPRRWFV